MNKEVLIVEDDNVTRKILRIYLVKWGYLVTEALDGEQGIEQMVKDDFGVVICDIITPRKNGWEVLQWIRSNPRTKDIPVIILSSEVKYADMLGALELGATCYLRKPFTEKQLLYGLQLASSED